MAIHSTMRSHWLRTWNGSSIFSASDKIAQPVVYAETVQRAQGMIHATSLEEARTVLPVTSSSTVKRYEDYTCITDTTSKAYQLLQQGIIGSDGLIRIDGYIAAALGQRYGKVGDRFIFTIGDKKMKIIMADAKANCDTDNGWTGKDGHVLEMIVCTSRLNEKSRLMGDCNYTIPGQIKRITRIKQ